MEYNTVVAIPHRRPSPFVNKFVVAEGVFEGIDYGEWGGTVRFLPHNVVTYLANPRQCMFCKSTTKNCCRLDRLPREKNVFKGVFENVDYIEYNGTGIFLFSPRDNDSMINLIDENCLGFFEIENKKFAVTGLEHMDKDYGKIYELVLTEDGYVANKILNIGCCPKVLLALENAVYIATETSFLIFKNNRLYPLFDIQEDFYPGSIVYADRCLFIGMRAGCMCKYDLETKKSEWYQYRGKPLV